MDGRVGDLADAIRYLKGHTLVRLPTVYFSKICPVVSRSRSIERVGEASTNLTVGQPRLTSGERSISEDPAPRQAGCVKTF
jgi:hypothetical protein